MTRFAILLLALFAVTGWLLSMGFQTDADRQAILVSAGLAAAVQLATFGLIQMLGRQYTLAGWGMGIVIRGTVFAFYGLLLAKMLGLPLSAALVSFAVFLFVSMLLESYLISNAS